MASQAALKIPLSRRRLTNEPSDSPKLVDLLQTNPLLAQSTDPLSTQGKDQNIAKPTDPLMPLQNEPLPEEENKPMT